MSILAQFRSWVTTGGTRKCPDRFGQHYVKVFNSHKTTSTEKLASQLRNWQNRQDTAILAQFRSWVTKVAHRNNLGRNS